MALLKEVKKETLQKEWRAASLLVAQMATIILVVFQALVVIGLNVNFSLKQFVIKPSANPVDFAALALGILVFALLYFAVKKRHPDLYNAQKSAPGIIKEEAKQKLQKAKEPQAPALLVIEIFFVVVVVLALRAFFDPDIELIPWSRLGLGAPFTTIINAVIAIAVLGAFYYLYSFTSAYRNG